MSKQFHAWILKAVALVVLLVAFGGGEVFCAGSDCDDHAVAAEHGHDDSGTTPESGSHDCGCQCHVHVSLIATPSAEVVSRQDSYAADTLEQVAPSAPTADIEHPPQLA